MDEDGDGYSLSGWQSRELVMSDVMLFQSALGGGEIDCTNGVVALDNSPRSATFLSLFGGNLEDNGTSATAAQQWWGNATETDQTRHMRSRTQAILIGLPAITSNLQRVEEAALADLAWMKQDLADDIKVTASLPARNTIRLLVKITGRNGTPWTFDFSQKWGSSS